MYACIVVLRIGRISCSTRSERVGYPAGPFPRIPEDGEKLTTLLVLYLRVHEQFSYMGQRIGQDIEKMMDLLFDSSARLLRERDIFSAPRGVSAQFAAWR